MKKPREGELRWKEEVWHLQGYALPHKHLAGNRTESVTLKTLQQYLNGKWVDVPTVESK